MAGQPHAAAGSRSRAGGGRRCEVRRCSHTAGDRSQLQRCSSRRERICCGFLPRLVSRYFCPDDQKSLSREGSSLVEFTFLTEQTCLNVSLSSKIRL